MKPKFYLAAAIASFVFLASIILPVRAADLGGNCCADLEERVAELEATAARKGGKKMSLTVSGQINKALLWHDIEGLPGEGKLRNIDNANSGSRLRFEGAAKIGNGFAAGFLYEFGLDESKGKLLNDMFAADDISMRHSAAWLSSPLGKITIGHTSSATDGVGEITLANTVVASLPLSIEPMWTYAGAPSIGGVSLNPLAYDGGRAQIVRYDTPSLYGFEAAASFGGGNTVAGDDMYDVAARYVGEFAGIRVAGGIGYRVEKYDGFAPETKTAVGSASVMHMLTGLFVSVHGADQKDSLIFADSRMWQATAGIERNFFGIGTTTLYAEYAEHELRTYGITSEFIGGGIVQRIDAAAMDVFISGRQYDVGGALDATVIMGGARIKF